MKNNIRVNSQIVMTSLLINLLTISYLSNIHFLLVILVAQIFVILFKIRNYKQVFIKTLLIVPFTVLISLSFFISSGFDLNSELVSFGKVLVIKVVLSMLMLVYITTKYSIEFILSGISKMKLPITLVNILNLTYRYFVMIQQDILKEKRALNARGLKVRKKKRIMIFGQWIGGLVLKASDHSDKVYYALNARGFSQKNNNKLAYFETRTDLVFICLNILSIIIVIFLERLL